MKTESFYISCPENSYDNLKVNVDNIYRKFPIQALAGKKNCRGGKYDFSKIYEAI